MRYDKSLTFQELEMACLDVAYGHHLVGLPDPNIVFTFNFTEDYNTTLENMRERLPFLRVDVQQPTPQLEHITKLVFPSGYYAYLIAKPTN